MPLAHSCAAEFCAPNFPIGLANRLPVRCAGGRMTCTAPARFSLPSSALSAVCFLTFLSVSVTAALRRSVSESSLHLFGMSQLATRTGCVCPIPCKRARWDSAPRPRQRLAEFPSQANSLSNRALPLRLFKISFYLFDCYAFQVHAYIAKHSPHSLQKRAPVFAVYP